jgi:ABC-2 type transport system permease protein
MLSLYLRLIGARIRAQMQYRASFLIELFSFALVTGIEFGVLVILLNRFNAVGGWNLHEVALLYGISSMALSLPEMIGRGFDAPFERMMQQGAFDGILLRPWGSFFLILASEFQLRRLGRTIQGFGAFAFGAAALPIAWSLDKALVLLLAIASSALIYMGLFVIGAAICFWTIKAPEVINAFTFGGQQLTSYPLSIYSDVIRTVFLSIVPLGIAIYPASLYLLGRTDPHGLPAALAWVAPLAAAAFMWVALAFWRYGVSKYQSVGS